MKRHIWSFLVPVMLLASCASVQRMSGADMIPKELIQSRRLLIYGEHARIKDVQVYAARYHAAAFYQGSSGPISDSVYDGIAAITPTASTRNLASALETMNDIGSTWTIIVLQRARRQLLRALQLLPDGGLNKMLGSTVVLVGWQQSGDAEVENALARTCSALLVTYE